MMKLNDPGMGGRVARAADSLNVSPNSSSTIVVRAARAGRAVRRRIGMRTRWGEVRPSAQDWVLPDGQTVSAAIEARRAAMKRQVAGLFA